LPLPQSERKGERREKEGKSWKKRKKGEASTSPSDAVLLHFPHITGQKREKRVTDNLERGKEENDSPRAS